MIKLTQEMMVDLSFPDYGVKNMEFLPDHKTLTIVVEGGFLDSSQGTYGNLGPGVLFFSDWESITIERFDSVTNTLSLVEEFPIESLVDLCEVEFSNSIVSLGGFGSKTDKWLEWIIVKPKMHAEFEEYQEDES